MQEKRIAVRCIFGITGQKKAARMDPDWCKRNCEVRDEMERRDRPQRCYNHFKDMHVDLTKK